MAVTDPRPGEALATGDAVNAAARLEQAAEPGPGARRRAHRAGRPPLPLRRAAASLEVRGQGRAAARGRAARRAADHRGHAVGHARAARRPPPRARAAHHDVPARRRGGAAASRDALRRGRRRQEPRWSPSCSRGSRPARRAAGRARALPRLRRRHQLLAAGRDAEGARAGARHRLRPTSRARASSTRRRGRARGGRRRRGRASSRPSSRRASASAADRPLAAQRAGAARRDAPRLALVLLGAGRAGADRSCSSRTSSGPTPRCSSCSRTSPSHAAGPLFMLCTARPELTTRRPTWGGGRRSFTGLVVEPLDAERERASWSS